MHLSQFISYLTPNRQQEPPQPAAQEPKEDNEEFLRANRQFRANLELQQERSDDKKARWDKENRQWNAFKGENVKDLDRKEAARQLSREMANEALAEESEGEENQAIGLYQQRRQPNQRVTLEKPIYKAREHITGYGRLQGNYYGLTVAEARLFGKIS